MDVSVAIIPVVVGLLMGLAFKHFSAVETNSGILCLTLTLKIIFPREKMSLGLLHEELQEQCEDDIHCVGDRQHTLILNPPTHKCSKIKANERIIQTSKFLVYSLEMIKFSLLSNPSVG